MRDKLLDILTNHGAQNYHSHTHTLTHSPYVVIASLKAVRLEKITGFEQKQKAYMLDKTPANFQLEVRFS